MTNPKITVKLPNSAPSKPAARGRIMDFTPRRSSATQSHPGSAAQPRSNSAAQSRRGSTPSSRSQAAQTQPARPASTSVARPTSTRRKATPLRPLKPHQTVSLRPRKTLAPASVRTAASRRSTPVTKSAVVWPLPTATPVSAAPKPLKDYKDLDNYTDFDDLTLGIIEDVDTPLDQRIEQQASTPVEPPTQDKHNFFLPGKSPFINTEKLEKRPLSAFRPDTQLRKNNYVSRLSEASQEKDIPTMVTTSASKRNSFGLVIAVLCTIALGAIVGAIVYLAFFQD